MAASCSSSSGVNVHYGSNNINAGPLKEIEEICVDHFHGDSLKSSVFFLTHAHTDHMVGLEGSDFLRRLNQPGVVLYTHLITPILLTAFDRYLGGSGGQKELIKRGKIVPCETLKPYTLKIKSLRGVYDQYFNVTVTLLPAEHCPGSVMFLFETDSLRILHTGDFRQTVAGFQSLKALHDPRTGLLKKIDHLYVDTTFCTMECGSIFPLREDVIQKAITILKEWIADPDSSGNWIYIKFAAKFAHEYMLVMLHQAFGKKIHVTERRSGVYNNINNKFLIDAITLDGKSTPFHFCEDRNCKEGLSLEMKLSSMWYALRTNNKAVQQPTSGTRGGRRGGRGSASNRAWKACDTVIRTPRRLNVCYSMHPSLQEVVETIEYLKPEVVTPLVRPMASNLHDIKLAFQLHCNHSFLYADYWSPNEIINPKQKQNKRKHGHNDLDDDEDNSYLSLGPLQLHRGKYPEDIDPDDDDSSDSDTEAEDPTKTTEKLTFNPDPIASIASNFHFDKFDLSPPKKAIGRIPITDKNHPFRGFYMDSESPSSSGSSGGNSQNLLNSQETNMDEHEFSGSPPNKRPCESNPSPSVVRKLEFKTTSASTTTTNLNASPDLSTPVPVAGPSSFKENKGLAITARRMLSSSSPVEVITISDSDSETDFEIESNSSNSQKSQSLLA